MPRKSIKEVVADANLRCMRIYPIESTQKNVSDLKTIGIKHSKQQAINLARALLLASQDWEEMEITGYRLKRRSDETYQLTLTTYMDD